MAGKDAFTAEEWNKVLQGLMLAGVAVTAADPSGIWGTMKEGMANVGALREVWNGHTDNELLKAIGEEFKTSEGRKLAQDTLKATFEGAGSEEIMSRAMAGLKDVAMLVEAKAPADAPEYKRFLMDIGRRVAEAAKEGSILGFGGELVSPAEESVLDDMKRALAV